MEQIEMINKLMAKVDDLLHSPSTGTSSAGSPMTRSIVILNNHRVDLYLVDFKEVFAEVDKSTKRLTLAETIAAIVK